MSFTTEVGKISIHLRSSDKDNNKIEVKISDDDKKKLAYLVDIQYMMRLNEDILKNMKHYVNLLKKLPYLMKRKKIVGVR